MLEPQWQAKKSVSFRRFWLCVAQELGSAWLRLDPKARRLQEFIASSYDPKEYLRDIITQSYKRSHCCGLDSDINLDALLDILGETAYGLRGQKRDDLFDIELLEEIGWLIGDRYRHMLPVQHGDVPDQPRSENSSAPVVSFPDFRIRKANARL